jgi:hypothetical protein
MYKFPSWFIFWSTNHYFKWPTKKKLENMPDHTHVFHAFTISLYISLSLDDSLSLSLSLSLSPKTSFFAEGGVCIYVCVCVCVRSVCVCVCACVCVCVCVVCVYGVCVGVSGCEQWVRCLLWLTAVSMCVKTGAAAVQVQQARCGGQRYLPHVVGISPRRGRERATSRRLLPRLGGAFLQPGAGHTPGCGRAVVFSTGGVCAAR